MTKPCLLLVPAFTELEWGIRDELEQWAEVESFDVPGVGNEPLPAGLELEPEKAPELIPRWRQATVDRGLLEVDGRGWHSFFVVTDSRGVAAAVQLARARRDSVLGLAIGHASLSHATEGPRAPTRGEIWDAVAQLARQGNEAFVRYGIAQATRGGVDEKTAEKMIERFPDMELVAAVVDAIGHEPEPVGDDLRALGRPLLLAKHEGCLGSTDEGFEDIVAAFPDARTVICPEACSSSPAFAEGLQAFCAEFQSPSEDSSSSS